MTARSPSWQRSSKSAPRPLYCRAAAFTRGLKSFTIWAAYGQFEEKLKGSLQKGKLADLVILSDNPLTVDPMKIKDITVVETIKEGVTIYTAI